MKVLVPRVLINLDYHGILIFIILIRKKYLIVLMHISMILLRLNIFDFSCYKLQCKEFEVSGHHHSVEQMGVGVRVLFPVPQQNCLLFFQI